VSGIVVLEPVIPTLALSVPETLELVPVVRIVAVTKPVGVPPGSVTVAVTFTLEPALAVAAEIVEASTATVEAELTVITVAAEVLDA
jgi:hypothetical protein